MSMCFFGRHLVDNFGRLWPIEIRCVSRAGSVKGTGRPGGGWSIDGAVHCICNVRSEHFCVAGAFELGRGHGNARVTWVSELGTVDLVVLVASSSVTEAEI